MKQAKDFTSTFANGQTAKRGDRAAKNFVGGGFDPMRTYPKTIKPTAQTTPLGGRFKGSNTSGEFPKKFNRGAFRPTGTTNMDYTGRRKPSKNFSGM